MNRTSAQSHRGTRRARPCGITLLLLLPLLLLACASSKEEDNGGDPLGCTLNTSFVERSVQSGSVILRTESTPCAELNLDVAFNGVSDIFTVGFDLTYPTGVFTFDGYTEGPLLKQGPPATPPFFSVTHDPGTGRILVFATRFSPDAAVNSSGSSVLLTLHFNALAAGQGAVLFDLSASPVQEQVLNDSGGAVSVTFVNGSNTARVF